MDVKLDGKKEGGVGILEEREREGRCEIRWGEGRRSREFGRERE